MGTTEQWVAAPLAAAPFLERKDATRLDTSVGSSREWATWKLPFESDVDRYEKRALGLVRESSYPMLFAWIQDSDFAAIMCADARGTVGRTVLHPEAAAMYAEGQLFLNRDAGDENWPRGISDWSQAGPGQVEESALIEAVATRSPVVDDEVLALLSALGIESPTSSPRAAELVMPLEGKIRVGNREIDTSKLPYVMGSGRDASGNRFVGIWKRGESGPAIERFPEGAHVSAHARLIELSQIDG